MNFYTNVQTKGNKIVCCGYNNGERFVEEVDFNPSLFIQDNQKTEYTSHDGAPLKKLVKPLNEYFKFLRDYREVMPIYGDISPIHQFIQERCVKHNEYYDVTKVRIAYFDIEVSDKNGFPHVNEASQPILSISIKDSKTNDYYVLSLNGDYDFAKTEIKLECGKFNYKNFEGDEKMMLMAFIKVLKYIDPDVITGWFCEVFDIPYITNRIDKLIGIKCMTILSPIGRVTQRNIKFKHKDEEISYWEFGIPVLDYVMLYKKFTIQKRDAYSLDFIAEFELGEHKFEMDEDMSMDDFTLNQHQKFIDYNMWDTELVWKLNEKLRLVELLCMMAYEARTIYTDVYSPVKLWDSLIYNGLKKKGLEIVPFKHKPKENYPGAYVKEPVVCLREWVIALDLNSLYPNIVATQNLGKQQLVEWEDLPHEIVDEFIDKVREKYDRTLNVNKFYVKVIDAFVNGEFDMSLLKKHNLTMTPNLQFWKKDSRSIIGELMEDFYNKRVVVQKKISKLKKEKEFGKTKSLNLTQYALKIFMNSGYGAFANEYFRYYDVRIACGITTMGRYIILYFSKRLHEELPWVEVIYNDTDSAYLTVNPVIQKLLTTRPELVGDTKKIAEMLVAVMNTKIQPVITKILNEICVNFNSFKNTLGMKMEFIGDKAIWLAKKKYVIRTVTDGDEFLEKPKIKNVGVEIIQTSTPPAIRNKLKAMVELLFAGTKQEVIDEVVKYKEEFIKLEPEKIAFFKTANKVETFYSEENSAKEYIKGTPMQVRASILYNKFIESNNLMRKFSPVGGADKVRYVYMKIPNKCGNENVFGCAAKFPKQACVAEYLDYNTQFEKIFLAPLNRLTKAMGWSIIDELKPRKKVNMSFLFLKKPEIK